MPKEEEEQKKRKEGQKAAMNGCGDLGGKEKGRGFAALDDKKHVSSIKGNMAM
jgi:hypothetical protein